MAIPQWKLELQPASFNGVEFKVDVSSRGGGRRIANHEYPKRDIPYAEDMGRKSRRFTITGYVIGPFYKDQRDALIDQLEIEGPGTLILPTGMTRASEQLVTIENYSVTERRERGGIATFEMSFLEFGVNTSTLTFNDTPSQVNGAVDNSLDAMVPTDL